MKKLFFLSLLCSTVIVRGQSTNTVVVQQPTNAPAGQPASTNVFTSFQSDPLSIELSRKLQPSALEPLEAKPNELTLGKVKVSGIAVEAGKTKQPLQLINPFSPPTNSSPEDNVVRDPFNGKVNGLKVFAIHF
jgi:hypothetical protein